MNMYVVGRNIDNLAMVITGMKGLPVPTSTLSNILMESDKWLVVKVLEGGT